MTPLGVLITPPPQILVSEQIRSALPKKATVRLLERTERTAGTEHVIVYELGSKFEPDSHVAVLKGGQLVSDFGLAKLFTVRGTGGRYALFAATQFRTAENKNAFITAFRNIGNGAGTIFVLLIERNGHYSAWKYGGFQGRFQVRTDGRIQVWSAGDVPEGKIDCTWCRRRYDVSTFEWKDASLAKVGHLTKKGALDPASIANKPIVLQK